MMRGGRTARARINHMKRSTTGDSTASEQMDPNKKFCGMRPKVAVFVFIFGGLFLMACAAAPSHWYSQQHARRRGEAHIYPPELSPEELENEDRIIIEASIDAVKPVSHEATAVVNIFPAGIYAEMDRGGLAYIPDADYLTVTMGKEHSFVKITGNDFTDQAGVFLLDTQTPLYDYPFDEFKLKFHLEAAKVNTTVFNREFLPVGAEIFGQLQIWHSTISYSELADNMVDVEIIFFRTLSVKVMAIFICFLMWMAAVSLFVLTIMQILVADGGWDVPAIAVGVLFALPFIRDVMPDVPAVGVAVDFLCFYWVLLVTVASSVIGIVLAIKQGKGYKMLVVNADGQVVEVNAADAASVRSALSPSARLALNPSLKLAQSETVQQHKSPGPESPVKQKSVGFPDDANASFEVPVMAQHDTHDVPGLAVSDERLEDRQRPPTAQLRPEATQEAAFDQGKSRLSLMEEGRTLWDAVPDDDSLLQDRNVVKK
uniref:Uncharacterized protein n=1 Tax=Chromera velia CCMP2878 TaxID=1169474 RepID=A0A0G4GAB5_9ALVE|eukprot:Cvel_20885.t1-p1 / transcript=Cvel_20885.t1 / gene=Cvel_20885 / organism=Chromera_velia_CCMP2878 / gene_product=hypothetical protein / transcript_product=hypothetical protein / location=Cvel_scaffold1915:972-5633(-) / protein_length=485 / sequence_SO=supercontig / SO=protein_coding / is_pseudo=false